MEDVRELVAEEGEADDENDRKEHDPNEVIVVFFVLPHAQGTNGSGAANSPERGNNV